MKRSFRSKRLLGDGSLVAHGLPAAAASYPDPGVAVGAAEVFAELVALHVGAGRDDGGVAIESNHHVADIDGLVAKLSTLAGGDRFLLGGHLSKRADRNVVVGKRFFWEFRIAAEAGFLGLVLHVNNLADGLLLGWRGRADGRPGTYGHTLGAEGRDSRKHAAQQQYTFVHHHETSAESEGTEIRLTGLRRIGCFGSVEKFRS